MRAAVAPARHPPGWRLAADQLRRQRLRLRPEQVRQPPNPRASGTRVTQWWIARRAGCSPRSYRDYETGVRAPSPESVPAIADALLFDDRQTQWLQQLAAHTPGLGAAPAGAVEVLTALVTWHWLGPACAVDHRWDLIAANAQCQRLAPSLLEEGNLCRWLLSGAAEPRRLLPAWPDEARAMLGAVRAMQAHHPDDPRYDAMIEPLADRLPIVDQLWRQSLHIRHLPPQSTCQLRGPDGTVKTWMLRRVQPAACGYTGLQALLFN